MPRSAADPLVGLYFAEKIRVLAEPFSVTTPQNFFLPPN
jgi:hypothetical protein